MTEVERLAERLLDLVSNFTKESYRETLTNSAALIRSQAEELERLRSDITRQMAIANSECNRAERLWGALGEARDTFDKMGKAIAETCPATFAQEIAVCKLSCDEISAALRETKAAPEQEPLGA